MPLQQILPTWVALNNANFVSSTGITDPRTGESFPAGGLNAGDYFDVTEMEANSLSDTAIGICHAGRYRLVKLDSGATVANVATGTIGYLRSGLTVSGVLPLTQGVSVPAGTYPLVFTGGGGSGAAGFITVGSGGTLAGALPVITYGGTGYTSTPAVTIVVPSGTAPTFIAQMDASFNLVTSYDQQANKTRPVIFLNSPTPGNYTFIQELGLATVLGAAAVGDSTVGDWVDSAAGGLAVARVATGSPIGATIGRAWDAPENSSLFKVILTGPVVQG